MDPGPRHADAQRWRAARSLEELCELGARFVEGRLGCFPGWGAEALDVESDELSATLARLNRGGLLTLCSQPGRSDPARALEQRAFVGGFATPAAEARLARFAQGPRAGLRLVMAGDVAPAGVPVTLEGGLVRVEIGHAPHAAERECFADWLAPGLLDELERWPCVWAWSLVWGADEEFWRELTRTLDAGREHG